MEKTPTPFAVIPVLLPGLQDGDLPLGTFLALNTWIDLRQGALTSLRRCSAWSRARKDGRSTVFRPTGCLPVCAPIAAYCRSASRMPACSSVAFGSSTSWWPRSGSARLPTRWRLSAAPAAASLRSSNAGLFPALRREKGAGRQAVWDIVSLRPQAEPLHQLARAFAPSAQDADPIAARAALNAHAERFRKGEVTVAELVRDRLQADQGSTRLLLYVDQWEELYTQAQPREAESAEDQRRIEDARRFIDLLLDAAATAPCTLVLSVRSDFYPDLQSHDRLRAAVQDGQVSLGPMSAAGADGRDRGPGPGDRQPCASRSDRAPDPGHRPRRDGRAGRPVRHRQAAAARVRARAGLGQAEGRVRSGSASMPGLSRRSRNAPTSSTNSCQRRSRRPPSACS